jgi:hexosaminidase
MDALSEVVWSPKSARNWEDFKKKLPYQLKRYDIWKTHYFNDVQEYDVH